MPWRNFQQPEPEPVAEAAGKPMRKTHSVGGKELGENMEVPAEKVSNTGTVISPYVSYLSSLRKRTILQSDSSTRVKRT